MEKRLFKATEVRAERRGKQMTVRGYAATYGTLSGMLPGGFRERIAPGAFKRILSTNPDAVVMLLNHDENKVLGRTGAGTLRLREDSKGLAFECDLPDTQAGRETFESVQRGDLNAMSFAFNLDNQTMCDYAEEEVEDDSVRGAVKRFVKTVVRTIRDFANLFDVSIVTYPAYPGTSVNPRSVVVAAEVRSLVEATRKDTWRAVPLSKEKWHFYRNNETKPAEVYDHGVLVEVDGQPTPAARRRRMLQEFLLD